MLDKRQALSGGKTDFENYKPKLKPLDISQFSCMQRKGDIKTLNSYIERVFNNQGDDHVQT